MKNRQYFGLNAPFAMYFAVLNGEVRLTVRSAVRNFTYKDTILSEDIVFATKILTERFKDWCEEDVTIEWLNRFQ